MRARAANGQDFRKEFATPIIAPAYKEQAMESEARLSALAEKHAELERQIEEESHRPLPDSLLLTELKRQKLRVKEELAHIKGAA